MICPFPVSPLAQMGCVPWSSESGMGAYGAAVELCVIAVPCQLCSRDLCKAGAIQCTAGCCFSQSKTTWHSVLAMEVSRCKHFMLIVPHGQIVCHLPSIFASWDNVLSNDSAWAIRSVILQLTVIGFKLAVNAVKIHDMDMWLTWAFRQSTETAAVWLFTGLMVACQASIIQWEAQSSTAALLGS